METSSDIWQVDAGGQTYETNFEELAQWIAEGSLLPQDKIRRGNLRWIEAGKVPVLQGFFNAKDLGIAPPQTVNTSKIGVSIETNTKNCFIHNSANADFECETCLNNFCSECLPNSWATAHNCPMCGANCKKINLPPQSSFSSLNPEVEPTPNPTPNPIPINQPSSPIDYSSKNPFEKSGKKIGIFSIIFFALLFSLPIAYAWVYHFSEPDLEAEKKLPKILILEEVYKTEKDFEDLKLKQEQAAAQLVNESKKSVTNEYSSSSSSRSSSMLGKMNETAKSLEAMHENIEESAKNPTYSIPPSTQTPPTSEPVIKAKEKFDQESKIVIEEYRSQTNSRKFWMMFLISFFGIAVLIFAKRKLVNK